MDKSDSHASNNIIILHPDIEKLKSEVEKLRTELSMLVFERDKLLHHECKNIETVYMLSVGAFEYKIYEIECAILRQKRKIELIQTKINRQEKIIVSQIENTLDFEFAEYQAKINEQIDKMNAALERSQGKFLTDTEHKELIKLYRSIVKALHPDLHPHQDDSRRQLFHNALEAYEHGDLNGLQIIHTMVVDTVFPEMRDEGSAHLTKEKKRLTLLLEGIKSRIEQIKSEYPYTMKSFVQEPEKLAARKTGLEKEIERLNDLLSTYHEKIAEMLR
jgi:hypothetical protein